MFDYLFDYLLGRLEVSWRELALYPSLLEKWWSVKSTAYIDPCDGSVIGWSQVCLKTRQRLVRPKPFL